MKFCIAAFLKFSLDPIFLYIHPIYKQLTDVAYKFE